MIKLKILVTGGYGFIGSALVKGLLKENHIVTIIDDLSTGKLDNIKSNVRTFNISITDKNCERIFKDTSFDVVIHLAIRKLPKDSSEEDNDILWLNNEGLINILYFSQKYKVGKFIMLSPYTIYGKQDVFPIKEDFALAPLDEEGYQAQINEFYCNQYRRKGLDVSIFRVGEIYGPRQNNENSFIHKLLSIPDPNKDLILEANDTKLDYIYIGDVVEALKIACVSKTPNILNISTGKGTGEYEIFQMVSIHTDKFKDMVIKEVESIDQNYILDNKKAIFNLEWSPKYEMLEGLKRTINWYENNNSNSTTEKVVQIEKKKGLRQYRTWNNNYRDIENVILFIIFALANYFLQYRLSIKIDLFLLYIVFINLFYGFKQGSFAVILSVITNIVFKLRFDNMKTFNLISDPSIILYATMYFIIGVSIGNLIDRIRADKQILTDGLADAVENMDFVSDIYEKSLEIKNELQNTIERYDDSFQRTLDVVIRLEELEEHEILGESRNILSVILQTNNIYIYSISADKKQIELVGSPEVSAYESNMKIDKYDFLKTVISKQEIFINKSLVDSIPTMVAPLFKRNELVAVVFLDEIGFESLNYQYMNTLKVLIYLISNRLSRRSEYIKKISDSLVE